MRRRAGDEDIVEGPRLKTITTLHWTINAQVVPVLHVRLKDDDVTSKSCA